MESGRQQSERRWKETAGQPLGWRTGDIGGWRLVSSTVCQTASGVDGWIFKAAVMEGKCTMQSPIFIVATLR